MCGICGVLNHDGKPINRDELMKMNDAMAQRGPDDSGAYYNGSFGMAMRRLSIIDLPGGHQPLSNEDGTIHLVLNGEIYNYIELRKDMEKRGHRFKTNSDVEVLIHLYEEYGLNAIDHLNGMFAFALWDEKKQRLWLGRDRLGIKPLVYRFNKNSFSFASTIDALAQQESFEKKINEDSILLFLMLAYIPTPNSIWENVHKLPPAHWLLVENGEIRTHKYWSIEKKDRNISHDEFLEEVKSHLDDSIELHGRSDVDVGSFLSGGLDSSAVTALFSQNSKRNIKTFSMDFMGKEDNEGHYAKMVADHYNTEHYAYELSPDKALSTLDSLLLDMDEPMADSAIIPSFLLSKMAKDAGLKVMLSGAGGDEVFGGYYRHYRSKRDRLAGKFQWVPSMIKNRLIDTIPSSFMQYACIASNSSGFSYGINTSGINLGILNNLMCNNGKFPKALDLLRAQFDGLPELEKEWGFSYSRMLFDIKHYLVDNVLAITDKTSMAASIEARVPLLDHRLVELAFSVRPEINLTGGFSDAKNSLKAVVRNDLPSQILTRSKAGFNGPVQRWIEEKIKHINPKKYLDTFSSSLLHDFIDANEMKKLLGSSSNSTQTSENIFIIMVLGQWLEGQR